MLCQYVVLREEERKDGKQNNVLHRNTLETSASVPWSFCTLKLQSFLKCKITSLKKKKPLFLFAFNQVLAHLVKDVKKIITTKLYMYVYQQNWPCNTYIYTSEDLQRRNWR